jgi:ribosomal protein S2
MGETTLKDLLEAGVHFGHQTKRWNPKMKPFLFAEKNGIHIIDLEKTLQCLTAARDAAREIAGNGKPVLFVGTKPQAKHAIKEQAERCNMPYVTERWLGRHAHQLQHRAQEPLAPHVPGEDGSRRLHQPVQQEGNLRLQQGARSAS